MTSPEQLHRIVGSIIVGVGVGSTLVPRLFLRPFGIPPADVTGAAQMGWRLFGIRTALIGGAVLKGSAEARAAVLPVQLADQLVFAHAARSGNVPVRAARMAQAVSGVLIALELLAARDA